MNRQVALTRHSLVNPEYTLERFAADNFRSPAPRPQGLGESFYEQLAPLNLWSYGREPLKLPLLKVHSRFENVLIGRKLLTKKCSVRFSKLQGKAEPSQAAVKGYLAILKYMGDYPCRRIFLITELTDKVFKGAFKYQILRDEIYCQLMKQLTHNYNTISLERGWELMWLCTGIFAPSQSLLKEVQLFLRTRTHPLASHCFTRLHRIQR
ncbi:unnamed protein product [Gongylonema pulchrum]|uniref:MyTH4 domain-containing protein n=1 Tax=Gongylonema pulchrum TaxID=637853 RepID=A0A183DKK6_9BILA|nr:unnamed protein product [Gongylonema pulchrum]